jgi:tartrate dehydratase beta subunit/fumarate hydratase class I family protein
MYRVVTSLAVSSLVLMGIQAFADDSVAHGPTTAQKHQMMKDCMAKQMAANSGTSKAAMKKACKDQMQLDYSGNMSSSPSK